MTLFVDRKRCMSLERSNIEVTQVGIDHSFDMDPLPSSIGPTGCVGLQVYETVRSLRQRRGDRLGAVQRKLPPVQCRGATRGAVGKVWVGMWRVGRCWKDVSTS